MNDMVSIIIPVYNAEQYIKRCITSILDQTYTNLQVIIINDGSTDMSGTICKEFQMYDRRIDYYEQKNGGAGAAKNAGLINSKGDYICFIDSDDFISNDYIQYLVNLLKTHDSDIAQASYISGFDSKFPRTNQKEKIIEYDNSIFQSNHYKSVVWGKVYRRELFNNLSFSPGRRIDDETIIYKLYFIAKKTVYSNLKKYYYYQSPNSVMRNQINEIDYDFITTFEERIEYFTNHNRTDLIDVTISRLCLSIIVKLSKNTHIADYDYDKLLAIYRKYSKLIKHSSNVNYKIKIIIRVFGFSPQAMIFFLKQRKR